MSDQTRRARSRAGPRDAASILVIALVGVHMLALGLVLANASSHPVTDPDVLRAERIATSPAIPYRNFPVEYMPLQTAIDRFLGGSGAGATATRFALLAFAADLAAAAGLWWGFGRRVTTTYLLLGLPLLSFMYLRFDLVAVALAVWAVAALAKERERPAGIALGLAVMAKLWPLVLAPLWLWRRNRRGLVAALGVLAVLGGWWYLTGGPKGPFQVISFRGARGWDTQSTVGSLEWLLGIGSVPIREADALRIGHASTLAQGVLFLGLVLTEAWVWWGGGGRDAAAAAPLAATATLLIFAPLYSMQYALWLLPWTALAAEGERRDRRAATWAAVTIALTGVIAVAWPDPTAVPAGWLKLVVVGRNLTTVGIVAGFLLRARAGGVHRPVSEPATA